MSARTWNLRKAQKLNGYFNLVAIVGILLVLASIPITFFSLRAEIDSDLVTGVFSESEVRFYNFTLYFSVREGRNDRLRLTDFEELVILAYNKGDAFLKDLVKQYTLPQPRYSKLVPHPTREYKELLVQPYSILLAVRKELGTRRGDKNYFRWIDKEKRTCELTHGSETLLFDFCLLVDKWNDGYGIALVGLGGAKEFSTTTRVVYDIKKPVLKIPNEGALAVSMDCFSQACRLTASCRLTIDVDDVLQSSVCTDETSQNRMYDTIRNPNATAQIAPLLTSNKPRIFVALQRPSSGTNVAFRPPPLIIEGLREQPKYSTLDIAVDSFAISSLIANCFTLFLLLGKLLMYIYSARLLRTDTSSL